MEKYNFRKHGITQSLLYKFMSCRQATRYFLDGWESRRQNSPALIYGTIVHAVLEKVYQRVMDGQLTKVPSRKRIKRYTDQIEKQWLKENPNQDQKTLEILYASLDMAETITPVYFRYWYVEDFKKAKWVHLEKQFAVRHKLSNGTRVLLRGKLDGAYRIGGSCRLFETKTKSQISEWNIYKTLGFELQVNLYFWMIQKLIKNISASGVTYNVIRKTSLKQRAKESTPLYLKRVTDDIKKRQDFYFMRFEVDISKKQTAKWFKEFDGLLIDFTNWCDGEAPTYRNTGHCINKYGSCEYLTACDDGYMSKLDYVQRKSMFNELEDI